MAWEAVKYIPDWEAVKLFCVCAVLRAVVVVPAGPARRSLEREGEEGGKAREIDIKG